jgi:hypothetical protein
MTCVSTAQQATEPVDTKQPLSSLIGTFGIHPFWEENCPHMVQFSSQKFLLVGPRQAR